MVAVCGALLEVCGENVTSRNASGRASPVFSSSKRYVTSGEKKLKFKLRWNDEPLDIQGEHDFRVIIWVEKCKNVRDVCTRIARDPGCFGVIGTFYVPRRQGDKCNSGDHNQRRHRYLPAA